MKALVIRYVCFLVLFMWWNKKLFSQTSSVDQVALDSVYVSKILIEGNKTTKEKIIYREFHFQKGDSLYRQHLTQHLDTLKDNLFNTNLFVKVEAHYRNLSDREIAIEVKLYEKWYILPVPVFDLVDRNLNTWIRVFNASLSRIRYGFRISWNNFRGRKEKLQAIFQTGFEDRAQLLYQVPFILENRQNNLVLSVSYNFTERKNIFYTNRQNREVPVSSENVLHTSHSLSASLGYRKGIYNYFGVNISYLDQHVNPEVIRLNPNYFRGDGLALRGLNISVGYASDRRNIRQYATRGNYFNIFLRKNGLLFSKNYDFWSLGLSLGKYFTMSKRLSSRSLMSVYLSTASEAYVESTGLGLGGSQYVRGYDLSVIRGTRYLLFKNTLQYRILNKTLNIKKIIPKPFALVPLEAYLIAYFDTGFVNKESEAYKGDQKLNNRLLWGYGLGIEFITYYNIQMRFEYSLNQFTKFNELNFNQLYFYYTVVF